MRASEVKALRRRDLGLEWVEGVIQSGQVIVPKSKTRAGRGRCIPFTRRVCAVLTMWLSYFPDAGPDSYVFPYHKVGIGGDSRVPRIWAVDLSRSMGEWKKAWAGILKSAGIYAASRASGSGVCSLQPVYDSGGCVLAGDS